MRKSNDLTCVAVSELGHQLTNACNGIIRKVAATRYRKGIRTRYEWCSSPVIPTCTSLVIRCRVLKNLLTEILTIYEKACHIHYSTVHNKFVGVCRYSICRDYGFYGSIDGCVM